eukprot:scaffold1123_cov347-Prasinococcus_capsulatus_cf.AAC.3
MAGVPSHRRGLVLSRRAGGPWLLRPGTADDVRRRRPGRGSVSARAGRPGPSGGMNDDGEPPSSSSPSLSSALPAARSASHRVMPIIIVMPSSPLARAAADARRRAGERWAQMFTNN